LILVLDHLDADRIAPHRGTKISISLALHELGISRDGKHACFKFERGHQAALRLKKLAEWEKRVSVKVN
jgi:hypothetical protein